MGACRRSPPTQSQYASTVRPFGRPEEVAPTASLPPFRFSVIAVTCARLLTAILALAVAHGSGPYGFEDPVFKWLGAPSTTATWANLSELLATPAIGVVLVVSVAVGIVRRGLPRVVAYAGVAALAFLTERARRQAPDPAELLRRAHLSVRKRHRGVRDRAGYVPGALPAAWKKSPPHPIRDQRRLDPLDGTGCGRRSLAHPLSMTSGRFCCPSAP